MAFSLKSYIGRGVSVSAGGTLVFESNLDWSKVKKVWVSIYVDGASIDARRCKVHFYQTGTTTKAAPSCYVWYPFVSESNVLTMDLLNAFPEGSIASDFMASARTKYDPTNNVYGIIYIFPHEFTTNIDIVLENGDPANAASFWVAIVALEM